MGKKRSLNTYRLIDLAAFAVMLCAFELIIQKAASGTVFRDQAFTVSLAGAMVSIVFMRWGLWGGIHAALAGAVYVFSCGGTARQLIVYALGNLLSLLIVPVMDRTGRERIRKSRLLFIPFGAGTLLLMQTGRALLSLLMGNPLSECLRFITTDSLSLVFTLVILWIARRLDGVYEDQLLYLERINREGPGEEESL